MLVILSNQRVDTYMLVGEKTNKDDSGGIGALSISSLEVALLLPLLSKPKRKKKRQNDDIYSNFQSRVQSNLRFRGFCFDPLCNRSITFTPLFQPIRCDSQLCHPRFPAFKTLDLF